MDTGVPDLRLRIPCNDEGDFYARLADRVAEQGLRVPTEVQRSIGSRVTLALELRNGGVLTCEGVIDAHVRMDVGRGVNVRVLRFAPRAAAPPPPPPSLPGAPARPAALPPEDEPLARTPSARRADPAQDEPLASDAFASGADPAPDGPAGGHGWSTVSGEIVETVNRRAARVQRTAAVLVVAALAVGTAGLAVARWLQPASAQAASAEHLEASDRLLAEGRLTGKDGALEHLLAAKRLRPDDPATGRRLARVADLLEALAGRALDRGDVAVAAIHLASAQLAAPDRPSIRAKLDAIAKRASADEAASAPAQRRTSGSGKRRTASR